MSPRGEEPPLRGSAWDRGNGPWGKGWHRPWAGAAWLLKAAAPRLIEAVVDARGCCSLQEIFCQGSQLFVGTAEWRHDPAGRRRGACVENL